MISWSFTDKKIEDTLKNTSSPIEINNPISSELFFKIIISRQFVNDNTKNINRNFGNSSVFEIGPVF